MPLRLLVSCLGDCRRRSKEYGYHGIHTSPRRTCVQPIEQPEPDAPPRLCGGRLAIHPQGHGLWTWKDKTT